MYFLSWSKANNTKTCLLPKIEDKRRIATAWIFLSEICPQNLMTESIEEIIAQSKIILR